MNNPERRVSAAGRGTVPGLLLAVLIAVAPQVARSGGEGGAPPLDFIPFEKQFRIDENPERVTWQKPEEVLSALGVAEGQVVADVGSGTGFFTRRFSPLLGSSGRIYAIDLDPRHLDYLEERAQEEGLDNIVPVLATPTDPKVPDGCCDLVFLCNTYHLIGDRVGYLRTLATKIKPTGRLALIDWLPGSTRRGAQEQRKVAPDVARRELQQAGFRLIEEPGFLPHQYFIVATSSR